MPAVCGTCIYSVSGMPYQGAVCTMQCSSPLHLKVIWGRPEGPVYEKCLQWTLQPAVCIVCGFGMYQRWVQCAGIVVCSVVLSVSKSHCMPHTAMCIVCGFVSEVGWLNAHAPGGESGAGWV